MRYYNIHRYPGKCVIVLSVCLDEDTEWHLTTVRRRHGDSKSEAVKRSLVDWLAGLEPPPDAYELGADLFDKGGAAEPPMGPLCRRIRERLNEKYRSRRYRLLGRTA